MTQPPTPQLLTKLQILLGPKGFTNDADILSPWLTDWRGKYQGAAAAMLSPANTEETARIVALCRVANVALVPQGGNSGMVGGATPDRSGEQLILSTRRMNRIRSIDRKSKVAVVEAGVILSDLHDAAEAQAMRFPLTLGGKGSATIGGLVSTNAGGTQVLRHGTMRSLVCGIEAVLPDGSVFEGLAPLKKDNRGYDLRHLLCGAEGTLGIITAASLSLSPAIVERRTAWVGLTSPDEALALLRGLQDKLGEHLEGFELIPHDCLDAVLKHIPQTRHPLAQNHPWYVLIECVAEETASINDDLQTALAQALDKGLIGDAVLAKNEREAEDFWHLRDSISEAERAEGPALQHDVSVPVDRMPQFIAENLVRVTQKFPGARVLSFGHLGDGNVHHHIQPPSDADGAEWLVKHGHCVSRCVYSHVIELGGSISAEHGIGQMKREMLAELAGPARLTALRGVKVGLDPTGIFNPGKLVP